MADCGHHDGACKVPGCQSKCKRCQCACDGVPPEVAILRKRGRPKKSDGSARPSPEHSTRRASKKARNSITDMLVNDVPDAGTSLAMMTSGKLIETRKDVWDAFGFTESMRKKLPSEHARNSDGKIRESNPGGWSTMVQSVLTATVKVAEILCPAMSQELVQDATDKVRGAVPAQKALMKLENVLIEHNNASPTLTIQKRVTQALLVKGLQKKRMESLQQEGRLHIGGYARMTALADSQAILEGLELIKPIQTRARVEEAVVIEAVSWILSPVNVGVLSWGTKVVKLSEQESVTLPCVTRRKTRKHMFDDYCKVFERQAKILGRSTFYRIVKEITGGEEKIFTAVDYVTGVLVHDSIEMLQKISDDFVQSNVDKVTLSRQLELVRNFFKQQYDSHVQIENDNVDTHGIEYGLKKLHPEKEINAAVRVETCNGCCFNVVVLKALCDKIKATGEGANPVKSQDTIKDALMVVNDIQQKLELYRAHRVRVANQQKAIYKIEEEMKQKCLESKISSKHALVVIDWKMKFESMSARETSQEHFGKRGIAWHGCLLKFFRYEEGSAVRYNVYADQIMEGSNKQDSLAVASMVEAFLYQIHEELSFLEEITLQSDNAGCYQSKDLVLTIALISALSPIKVTRFIHTETQDGKGDIDAHFARSMAHLVSFMHTSHSNKIQRIVTAKGLAAALAWGGGLQNSFVQLVGIDRPKLANLALILAPVVEKMKTYFSRLNDIFFLERIGPWISAALYDIEVLRQMAVAFKVRVFAYSGIGSGIVFDCNIQEQSFAPTQVDQESVLENEDGSDETEDNEDVADDEGGDYVLAANEEGTELNSSTAVVVGNKLIDEAAQIELEADLQDLDVALKTLPAVEQYMFYGPVNDKSKQKVTGVKVVKCSKLAGLKGLPRLHNQRTEKNMEDFRGDYVQQPPPRMDAVAIAVRCANDLIHSVLKVRSGKDDMVEYLQSQQLEIPQSSLKRQGWAWRPAHGDTYGTTYVHLYRTEIKEMFDRGVQTETEKMSPAIMLERLQEHYPNRYSLPGENEIRTEISSLLQKQKSGRMQRKSKFSTTYTEFIRNIFDQVLEQKDHQLDCVKPKEILTIVKQHFREENGSIPLDFPSDKYITAKVSNLKSMAKKEGHRNIMLC